MFDIVGKLLLLFDFFDIRKSKHVVTTRVFFIMRKSKKEHKLAHNCTLDLTLELRITYNV